MKSVNNKQSGAVSLFVVIFATLLITVVTVSFLRLMVGDQNRASNNDLSQSAYDSAQAGVEDAKRALLRYQKYCQSNSEAACKTLADQLVAADCNDALRIGGVINSTSGEVLVQQEVNPDSVSMDQAYTCVKMVLNTDDYIGSLSSNQSKLVPLVAIAPDGSTTFDRVTVEWFNAEDIGTAGANNFALDLRSGTNRPLFHQENWPINRPSVLRTQFMQFGSNGFRLSDFDTTTASSESNTNTVFLYPTTDGSNGPEPLTGRNLRASGANPTPPADATSAPLGTRCRANLSSGGYACTMTLELPQPVSGGDRTAFLRLTALYNATHFRVTLSSGAQPMKFNAVQPVIDSTGRANDLFRRVESRVDLYDTSFPYPDGAVDISSGSLCKDFSVTDTTYTAGSTPCTP